MLETAALYVLGVTGGDSRMACNVRLCWVGAAAGRTSVSLPETQGASPAAFVHDPPEEKEKNLPNAAAAAAAKGRQA